MKLITMLLVLLCSITTFAQAPAPTATTTNTTYSQGLTGVNVSRTGRYSIIGVISATAPAAKTMTCAITDICTATAHGFYTGLKVQFTTTTTLPAGLSLATDYYIIKLSADTFSVATSLANAQAGTPVVDITNTGTGVHTATAVAIAGASVKLQGSMDNTNYVDLPIKATGDATKSFTVTTTGNFFLGENDLNVNYVRVYVTLTAGQITMSTIDKVLKSNGAPY